MTVVDIPVPPAPEALVDQSFTGPLNLGSNINEGAAYVAQTYTAGVTGILAGVSIHVRPVRAMPSAHAIRPAGGFNFYRLHVALCAVRNGFPGAALAETMLESDEADLDTVIVFPDSPAQTAGTQYAIVVHYADAPPAGPGRGIGVWYGARGDCYPGGDLFYGPGGQVWFASSLSDHDAHFRTYVTPSPAPLAPAL